MGYELKTNTAIRLPVGPLVDPTDGKTAETSLTVTALLVQIYQMKTDGSAVVRASFNPTASGGANDMILVPSSTDGMYDLEITAAQINWLGNGRISLYDVDGFLVHYFDIQVVSANYFNNKYGSTIEQVNVTQWLTQACSAVSINGVPKVDITHLLGTAWLTPGVAGTPDVNTKKLGGTAQTGRDIGASVLLSSGSGAGQLDFTSGVVKSNLAQILGTALTETAGYIAAGFKKLFNIQTPVLTAESVNQSANNNTILAHGTYGSSALQVLVAALQTDLDNGTDGLGALKTLIDAVPTAGEIQTEIEANGASVIDTIRDYIEHVTYGLSALKTLIDANKTELDGLQGTDGKCLISTDAQDLSGSFDVNTKTATATALDLILKNSTFALAVADAIWDELITEATHGTATSAGKRMLEIGAYAIHSGTAQAGNSVQITLAATATAIDGTYNRNLLVLTDGTGKGQTRTIIDYNGTTKVAVTDREWRTDPDATSKYQIVADDTPLVSDQGIAQAGSTSSTIKLRAYASATNDIYLCNVVIIVAGTGRGQARLVGSYNGTTKIVTICGDNWTTTPDATSVYVMIPYGASCVGCVADNALAQINTEVDNALNTAIIESPTAGSINEKIKALPSGIAKNVALPILDIYMLLEDGITAATGKTVTGQIRKDAGAFTGLTNAITEVSGGLYTMADGIIQAEMNANKVTLKFTADGCRDTIIIIYPT